MKKSSKLFIGVCAAFLACSEVNAQTVKFVTIDSTAAYFLNADSIATRKAKVLAGLTDLATATPEFKKSLNEAASDKNFKLTDLKYYTKEFIEIPFEQYRKISFDISGQWSEDSFIDIGYNRKVVVLRESTDEEREKKVANLKGYFSAKTGTPIAQNEADINKMKGEMAPDFTVTTLDGKKISMSSLRGKVVVLNFWFTQCRPCVEEIPTLNAIAKKYEGRDDIVFLAPETVEKTTKEDIQKFLKRVPFAYQIALGGKEAAALYQARVFPANYLIDKNGKVQMGWVGLNPFSIAEMEKTIPTLLK